MLNKEKALHIGIPLKLDQVKAAVRVASKNLQIVTAQCSSRKESNNGHK